MKACGFLYGPDSHHLDHLAPLCALESLPLIVTDETIFALGKKYYPDLKLLLWDEREAPEKLVFEFDTVIYSIPRVLFDQIFFFAQALQKKRIKTIWCPHGNSDKGRHSPYMEALKDEELILTYGPRIENFLKEKGVEAPIKRIGNYRFAYYQKHKRFYDSLLPPKENPIVLYAPTWQDGEKNSSFPHVWTELLDPPDAFALWIKLHPHLYRQYPDEIAELKEKQQLIEDFPPIYPLLERADLLIGDASSINYDFLVFHRPMIRAEKNLYEKCEQMLGQSVDHTEKLNEVFVPYQSLHFNCDNSDIVPTI